MEKEFFTTHDIAKHCHVNMATVVNWIEDGSLRAHKTKGGHRRVQKNDLASFLSKHNMPSLRQRVLVVEDDTAIRKGLKDLLTAEGFEVDAASDGLMAGLLIGKHRPAVVIVDLIMPGLDGFYVCECIKKQGLEKEIKVIVLTGYPSKENINRAFQSGAIKVFAKPVDYAVILKEVQLLLGVPHA